MRTLLCVLLLLSSATVGLAQVVEFNPPSQIDLVPDQLSVTFKTGVAEDAARALISELGYEVVTAQFAPIQLYAAASKPLTEAQMTWLQAQAGVMAVLREDLGGGPEDPVTYQVTFAPETPEDAARATIRGLKGALRTARVEAQSNDLTIRIPAGEDELAITQLEARPEVDYVVYVAVME